MRLFAGIALLTCLGSFHCPVQAEPRYEYILDSAVFEQFNGKRFLSLHLRRRDTDFQFWVSYISEEFVEAEFNSIVGYIASAFARPSADQSYTDPAVNEGQVIDEIIEQFFHAYPHLIRGETL